MYLQVAAQPTVELVRRSHAVRPSLRIPVQPGVSAAGRYQALHTVLRQLCIVPAGGIAGLASAAATDSRPSIAATVASQRAQPALCARHNHA